MVDRRTNEHLSKTIMKKYGIFYGSSTGTTRSIARQIARRLGVEDSDVHSAAEASIGMLGEYQVLVMGTSTWGNGDMQENWYDLANGAEGVDLSDKKIALFGVGDETMTDTFCDGMAELRDKFLDTGATFIGAYNADGYDFEHSKAQFEDGQMIGLVLDEVNRPELTDHRLDVWCDLVKRQS